MTNLHHPYALQIEQMRVISTTFLTFPLKFNVFVHTNLSPVATYAARFMLISHVILNQLH